MSAAIAKKRGRPRKSIVPDGTPESVGERFGTELAAVTKSTTQKWTNITSPSKKTSGIKGKSKYTSEAVSKAASREKVMAKPARSLPLKTSSRSGTELPTLDPKAFERQKSSTILRQIAALKVDGELNEKAARSLATTSAASPSPPPPPPPLAQSSRRVPRSTDTQMSISDSSPEERKIPSIQSSAMPLPLTPPPTYHQWLPEPPILQLHRFQQPFSRSLSSTATTNAQQNPSDKKSLDSMRKANRMVTEASSPKARQGLNPGGFPVSYKSATRRVTAIIVAAPVAICMSWFLYERLVLGVEQKHLVGVLMTVQQKSSLSGPRPRPPQKRMPLMASRKPFNCILDDTALIAGLKRSTRDGVKKWVNSGSIRIFVPLHTLDRLRRLARSDERSSTYAEEALTWLDTITSLPDDAPNRRAVDLVHLQGGYEIFDKWDEVEQFLLPKTLLSMESDTYEDPDSATESLADLRQDAMPDNASEISRESIEARTASPVSVSSAASPGLLNATPCKDLNTLQPIGTGRPSHKKSDSNVSSMSGEEPEKKQRRAIPIALRPFFNYILWRIHQEENATAALETFILVTNDPLKQQIAHRFGIRVKKLEQLREIIAREERDIKNREQMIKREMAIANSEPVALPDAEPEAEDDDEVISQRAPPKGPQAMNGSAVWDPNAFGRAPHPPPRPVGRGMPFRARGSPVRGNFAPRAMATTPSRQPPIDLTNPIDPDVFSRPPPANRVQRGGRRRLWEPT
ncbi:hypothetical protein FKW77_010567 [Venturia effusa]|uniref:PIN domain-containing protein n=1 Tax=Venturia effusa TaxID=50376 RepID=A0A517L0K8_9PEZI|nr:hypothetical protein FKW77_010567 [Venturia effusa]